MGSLQNLGNRGSNAAQQLAAQLSRSGGSSNPGVHSHQQGMLGGSGVGSGSSWGTGKKYSIELTAVHFPKHAPQIVSIYAVSLSTIFFRWWKINTNFGSFILFGSVRSARNGSPIFWGREWWIP